MERLETYAINEALETSSELPGYKIAWIDIKDKWAHKTDPKHRYSLVLFPTDKTKSVLVWRNFAWYTGGYDQGHYSEYQFYFTDAICGQVGNGHGQSAESKPYIHDVSRALELINDYLTKGKTYSSIIDDKIKDCLDEWNPGTKLSEIKTQLTSW